MGCRVHVARACPQRIGARGAARPLRWITLAVLLPAALWLGGCGGGRGPGPVVLTVYVSAPLSGPEAASGRAIGNGARLALAARRGRVGPFTVRAVYLNDAGPSGWSPVRTASNARRAAEDATAIGYLGELDSGATRASLPITNQAQMVQISPASTAVDLTRIPRAGAARPSSYRPSGRITFARVAPDDDVQAGGAALWAKRLGARRVAILRQPSAFGDVLAGAFDAEASALGLSTETLLARGGEPSRTLERALLAQHPDAVYYAGGAEAASPLLRAVAAALPGAPILASDALLQGSFLPSAGGWQARLHLTSSLRDPADLPPQGHRFAIAYRRHFGVAAAPSAAYGYESMALLLSAIRRAGSGGDHRDPVLREVLGTRARPSVIGTYSIDEDGDTTLRAISGYGVIAGRPVFETGLRAPGP